MMKIIAIDHLVLTTKDFDKCRHFYCDILGMELGCKNGHYSLHFGKQKINIHQKPAEFLPAATNIVSGALDLCLLTDTDL